MSEFLNWLKGSNKFPTFDDLLEARGTYFINTLELFYQDNIAQYNDAPTHREKARIIREYTERLELLDTTLQALQSVRPVAVVMKMILEKYRLLSIVASRNGLLTTILLKKLNEIKLKRLAESLENR